MSKFPGRIISNLAPAGYSVYFDGSNDRLIIANTSSAFPTGTQEFTLEFWAYKLNAWNTSDQFLFQDSATAGLQVWVNTAGGIFRVGSLGVAGIVDYAYSNLSINTWTHFAVSRKVNSWALWVNGTRVTTATYSSGLSSAVGTQTIGGASGSASWNGYVSNARIVRGTTVYDPASTTINVPTQLFVVPSTTLLTCNSPAIIDQSNNAFAITVNDNAAVSTFTPFPAYVPYNPALGASTPGVWTVDEAMQAAATRQWNMYDPYFNLTTLLLHGNPTNGTTWLTDASTNRFTLTPNGDARAANLSPFSLTTFATSGSGYFDGTGDFLTSTHPALNATFTIEAWVYRTSGSALQSIVFLNNGGVSGVVVYIDASNFLVVTDGVTGQSAFSNLTVPINAWAHIAVVRSGGTTTGYVNGVVAGSNSFTPATVSAATIARYSAGSPLFFPGYISNVRVVNGTAVYTGAFTPPTAPLTAITNTSLLTLQNSQSANNNAFLDSSSNNFLITRNGNTTQGTFSPFSQTGWSAYLTGVYGSSTFTSRTLFNGNSTIEGWVYANALSGQQTIIVGGGINFGTNGAKLRIDDGVNAGSIFESTGTITANTWNYVAVVRSSNTFSFYINGNLDSSNASISSFYTSNATSLNVGAFNSGGTNVFTGYLSNIRVSNVARTISLPTSAYSSDANTVWLIFQSNRFVDNSGNAYALTFVGTPSVQPFSPFLPTVAYTPQTIGGSGYFDGTGDYLTLADNAAFDLGTADFTFECWVYKTDNTEVSFLCSGATGLDFAYITAGGDTLRIGRYPVAWDAQVNYSIPRNAWTHIAFIKASGRSYFFANGTLLNAGGTANTNSYDTTTTLNVAVAGDGTRRLTGYMAGARLIKGQALATASFTLPTSPVTATSVGWTGAASSLTGSVSLLLNFTNAGVVDSTGDNVLETLGNAQISTTISRFGGSSIFMDGNGDYLQVAPNQLFDLKTSDFTVEFWIYPTTFASATYPMYSQLNRAAANVFALEVSTGGIVYAYVTAAGGGTWSLMNAGNLGTITLNTWNHVAFVRNGTAFRGYVNGVQGPLSTNSSSAIETFNGFNIGATGPGTGGYFTGYFDEYRISRYARYTGNFTPQTSQWQDQ